MLQSANQITFISKKRLWAGRVLCAIPGLFLLTSGINLALVQSPAVRESFARFGYPDSLMPARGVLEFICAVLYLVPRTSAFGALLLTAYLGGATATHVRIGDPTFIVPVVVGLLLWAGLYLRDAVPYQPRRGFADYSFKAPGNAFTSRSTSPSLVRNS
jgi:DoxX-like family